MVQLLFDDRLIDQLPMNKYKLANQSFKKWSLAPVKIGQQHLYLYVEEKTGMPIFSDQLGQDQFSILYSNLVETLGFLTAKQKEWLLDEIDFTSVYYRYLQPLTNPFLPQYEKFIEQHQKEFIKAAQQDNDVARNVTLLKLTSKLLKEMNLYDKVLASFVQNVNFLRPQKTHRPKANAKYVIYQPNFDDPRYWQESVKDELTDDDQNIIRIRKNNQSHSKRRVPTIPKLKGLSAPFLNYDSNIVLIINRLLSHSKEDGRMAEQLKWFKDDTLHQKYYPGNKLYKHYQDDVWGIPPHNDRSIFEQYTIGMFAAGLSWNASFLKYPELTKAYHNWDFGRIAKMGDDEVKAMLDNPKLIRNERKIRATISNAETVIKLQDKYGSLDNYFWQQMDYFQWRFRVPTISSLGTTIPLGDKIAKQMKKDGFKYAGPVSVYSFIVSIGLINARLDGKGFEDDPKSLIKPYSEQG